MKKVGNIFILLISLMFITELSAEDYYWVGGEGKWSDLNSWRTVTGQIPNEVPDENDNVIFNENSFVNKFDTVFILAGNPTCHNMTFTNIMDSIVLWGGSGSTSLNIHGSILLHTNVENRYVGKIAFHSDSPDETITCDNSKFAGDIWFEGSGEYTLVDSLTVWGDEDIGNTAVILQNNGSFNTNQQSVLCQGLRSEGGTVRSLNIQESEIWCIGDWSLNGEDLTFEATNSIIYMAGKMTNIDGGILTYHDVYFYPLTGSLTNTNVRSVHRLVHFWGSGSVAGKPTPGSEGSVTIDTLLFDGALDPMTGEPIECKVSGPDHIIHYTGFFLTHGIVDTEDGLFHRIDFWGEDFEEIFGPQFPSVLSGINNEVDSVWYKPDGMMIGKNQVNNWAYFGEDAIVSGIRNGTDLENTINIAECGADGWFNGNNVINSLKLNTGFWYRIGSDSLTGWTPVFRYRLKVGNIEVMGGCSEGMTRLTSGRKEYLAHMEYTGSELATEYLQVRDINNYGSFLTIDKGINEGNNFGIIFENEHEPRDLYWVDGEGDWTDETHWSEVPGQTPGDQCPPTIRDNVFFNALSGFQPEDTIFMNQKHAGVNDIMWEPVPNRPMMVGADTNTLHIWGSVKFDKTMTYAFMGDVYFESEDDEFYETIDIRNKFPGEDGNVDLNHLFGKVFFYGKGGKWTLQDSKLAVLGDTTFLSEGELLLETDTMHLFNFQSTDTLKKGLYMLGRSLVTVHQGGDVDAWNFESYRVDSMTFFDAGRSTIIAMGDITPMPFPGLCHVRSFGWEANDTLTYFNVQFGDADIGGMESKLKSVVENRFHKVDFFTVAGATDKGTRGIIDTLTCHDIAPGCVIDGDYKMNFAIFESDGDSLIKSHEIDTVLFKGNDGIVSGFHFIGYLQANQLVTLDMLNRIDTAVFYGNANILGHNTFSTVTLSPNKRYTFQHHVPDDTLKAVINDDFIVVGNCDEPIRLNSDSIGTEARIIYKALNHTNQFAKYASFKDITMVPYGTNEYIVENSVDLGNNTNLTFNNVNNNTYYWIGGSGNWGDWTHWSYTSGGPPIPEGCVPREINSVVFDDNSFPDSPDTVMVDVLNAYCKNMLWENKDQAGLFMGADTSVLYIYGSMELSDNMTYEYEGNLLFDQYEEPGDTTDIIFSRGHIILGDIYFQGLNDDIKLWDDLTNFIDTINEIFATVYHHHGGFSLNGNHMNVGSFMSNYKTPRTLNLDNSKMTVYRNTIKMQGALFRAYWLDATNVNFTAENSLIEKRYGAGNIFTVNGNNLKYNNIRLDGILQDSVTNRNNIVEYNNIVINTLGSVVTKKDTMGYYMADSVIMNEANCGIFTNSKTNVVILNGNFCGVYGDHQVNRCLVNTRGIIQAINGNNYIKYCRFRDDGYFRGENIFDTLVMLAGEGDFQNLGNKFILEENKTQLVNDSLYLRGHQCSNITIASRKPPTLAYLEVVNATTVPFISCDYLYINRVAAVSDEVEFYAGINSTPLPNPDNAPPGWVFDNAQGYIFGFEGRTESFCYGEPYTIKTNTFNGGPSTLYFWEGSSVPGGNTYQATEPGIYEVRVEYSEGCYVEDYIKLEADLPPEAWIEPGPYCEGDLIPVYVTPQNEEYKYVWANGDSTQSIVATLAMNDDGVSAVVTDVVSNCKANPEQMVYVKPTPNPDAYLGDDVAIKYGQSVTLDAGPGDTFVWEADHPEAILGSGQIITVQGIADTVTYTVTVTKDGCDSTGYKLVYMHPPSRLGIPTAFSPNGDSHNPKLKIYGDGFAEVDFRIYNRYGKLVFESNNHEDGWDGMVDGVKQEQEVYTYYVRVVFQDGEVREETGNITLLR